MDEAAGWRSALFAPTATNGWGRLDVAIERCVGCGGCNTGCRYGRKIGGLGNPKSYLEKARTAGVVVASRLKAERFEMKNGRARRLVLTDLDNGTTVRVEADAFVLAAGPLASTSVLWRTGLGWKLPLGQRASANVVTPVYGVFANPVGRPQEPGLQMCYFIGKKGELLNETWFHYPGSIAVSLPSWFEDNPKCMQDYAKMSCLGVVVPTGPHGSVGSDGKIYLALSDKEFRIMKQGIVSAAERMFSAGASKVYLASKDPVTIERADSGGLAARLDHELDEAGDLNLATAHPQGGNTISKDKTKSVVNKNFQVRDTPGVYVADASLFPAGCGVNPMMTTMALAHMAAEKVKEQF